jgi:hypothetical protein
VIVALNSNLLKQNLCLNPILLTSSSRPIRAIPPVLPFLFLLQYFLQLLPPSVPYAPSWRSRRTGGTGVGL